MEDDHVDRPGVEERQRLKLTGTNSSIDLIVLILNVHRCAMFSHRSRWFRPSGGASQERGASTGTKKEREGQTGSRETCSPARFIPTPPI